MTTPRLGFGPRHHGVVTVMAILRTRLDTIRTRRSLRIMTFLAELDRLDAEEQGLLITIKEKETTRMVN